VIKVRLVTDVETGKPRGFAFVEFEDPQAALSAIRNMNEYELNGRRLRVNFSNSSHLEALAGKLGMDLSQTQTRSSGGSSGNNATQHVHSAGTNAVADSLKSISKAEMYDVVAKMKEIADRDPDDARRLLSGHPQLPEAMLFIMSKLDMVQTSLSVKSNLGAPLGVSLPVPPSRVADPRARALDPRAAAAAAASSSSVIMSNSDPRSAANPGAPPAAVPPRADPRTRIADPRARPVPAPPMVPPPQPPRPNYGVPPPPMQPPPPPTASGLANLDPALVRQVMSLTPEMISQLPPHKQQSILALRQQISGSGM
jgi:cleavage stimulation factor subunit 2